DMDFKVAARRHPVVGPRRRAEAGQGGPLGHPRVLTEAIDAPDEMADTAPRVISVQIPVDKIGELIGPKRQDDQRDPGRDRRRHLDRGRRHRLHRRRRRPVRPRPGRPCAGQRHREPDEPGDRGPVPRHGRQDRDVRCLRVAAPGRDGLLHVSEVRKLAGGKRVENVEDVLGVGQKVLVEVTKVDDRGKLSLAPVVADEVDTEGREGHEKHTEDNAEG
ncbi:hypothetical protein Pfo_031602, partial [Paulownia fortunei]